MTLGLSLEWGEELKPAQRGLRTGNSWGKVVWFSLVTHFYFFRDKHFSVIEMLFIFATQLNLDSPTL